MSEDISLLPEDLRKKEDALKQSEQAKKRAPTSADLKFFIPKEEADDIEIIEIDEGEIEQVLASEPLVARLLYKATNLFEEAKHKLFSPQEPEPAPKLPPQFFTPPPIKAIPKPIAPAPAGSTAVAPPVAGMQPVPPAAKPNLSPSRVKLSPLPGAQNRRVRVIKRVRKPVRVSFVSDEDLHLMHIDVPKRKFTLAVMTVVCALLVGGGFFLLNVQRQAAHQNNADARAQLASTRTQIQDKQKTWNNYQDLQPRLKALSVLLNNHVSPTALLQDIENTTLPTVSYSAFSYSTDGHVQLSVTANSLVDAARQIVAFQHAPFVTQVDAQNYTFTYDPPQSPVAKSVQFQLTLTLAPNAVRASTLAANH